MKWHFYFLFYLVVAPLEAAAVVFLVQKQVAAELLCPFFVRLCGGWRGWGEEWGALFCVVDGGV